MQRKARTAREEHRARAMSPVKALRLALARAGDALFDLPLTVTTVEEVKTPLADLGQQLTGSGLLVLLDGAQGSDGAMMIDSGLLGAMIEMQTTGRVTGRGDATRPVTRTDAAIAAPLIDGTLERAEAMLGDVAAASWIPGHRFGVMMEDVRSLTLALGAAEYTCFRVLVNIGAAEIPGALTLVVPHLPRAEHSGPAERPQTTGDLAQSLARTIGEAPVALDAVLSRITLPLDRVTALVPGDRLPLIKEAALRLRLEASQRHLVARGKLGRMNGARAVRIEAVGSVARGDGKTSAKTPPGTRSDADPKQAAQAKSPAQDLPGKETAGETEFDAAHGTREAGGTGATARPTPEGEGEDMAEALTALTVQGP